MAAAATRDRDNLSSEEKRGPRRMAAGSVIIAVLALLVCGIAGGPPAAAAQSARGAKASRCGTRGPSSQASNVAQHAYLSAQQDPGEQAGANARAAPITIPVYFHIIRAGSSTAKGDVPSSYLSAQVKQLNFFYNKHGFQFKLAGVTRTTNRLLYTGMVGYSGRREYPIKRKTHRGSWATLNVWVAGSLRDPHDDPREVTAGYARFPYDVDTLGRYTNFYTPVLELDGITIAHNQMFRNASGRLTTTIPHETGHWLGLFHTFEGKCQTPGDGVDDTPYEAAPGFACKRRNTCVTRPGDDPIHNIMDYSSDDCQTHFTKGQGARMRKIWNLFRNPKTRRPHKAVSAETVYRYILA